MESDLFTGQLGGIQCSAEIFKNVEQLWNNWQWLGAY